MVFLFVVESIYILMNYSLIRKHQRKIKNQFSSISKRNLRWLSYFLIFFLIFIIISNIIFIGVAIFKFPSMLLYDFITIIATVAIFFLGFYGITQVPIYSSVSKKYDDETGIIQPEEEYRNIYNKLIHIVHGQKLYCNPNLTLSDLAEKLSISSRELATVIQKYVGKNFYDFINHLRVEEARKLIIKSENLSDGDILSIISRCGFESRDSFEHVFKLYMRMYPEQYFFNEKKEKGVYNWCIYRLFVQ